MKRTRLSDRPFPGYSRGEEIFNSVSHAAGAAFGLVALTACLTLSVIRGDRWAIAGSLIYGLSLVLLYTVSGVYHGLPKTMGKKVMQIIDHCAVYLLIAGTYTPILLTAVRRVSPRWCWILFAVVWGLAVIAASLTAIDLKRYAGFSMGCYVVMGWCVVLAWNTVIRALTLPGFLWLLAGGISYTVGAILYGVGKKRRWMHCVFHLFVVAGSILQFVCIIGYVL